MNTFVLSDQEVPFFSSSTTSGHSLDLDRRGSALSSNYNTVHSGGGGGGGSNSNRGSRRHSMMDVEAGLRRQGELLAHRVHSKNYWYKTDWIPYYIRVLMYVIYCTVHDSYILDSFQTQSNTPI